MQTYQILTEQLSVAQARVESHKADLVNAVKDASKEELLAEHDRLMRQDTQLATCLALVQQAVSYVEGFSPSECPVCDTAITKDDLLARLEGKSPSGAQAAELEAALAQVRARLDAITGAESTLAIAEANLASTESETTVARARLENDSRYWQMSGASVIKCW